MHSKPHAFDVAVAREKAERDAESTGVFIDGRLIKITRPKRELVRRTQAAASTVSVLTGWVVFPSGRRCRTTMWRCTWKATSTVWCAGGTAGST